MNQLHNRNPFLLKKELGLIDKADALKLKKKSFGICGKDSTGIPTITKCTYVDEEPFIGIYADRLSEWFSLKKTSLKVLVYVIKNIRKGQDYVIADINDFNLGKASFYKGIKELCQKGIIAKSVSSHMYWINPAFIYTGGAIGFTYIIKKNDADKTTSSES